MGNNISTDTNNDDNIDKVMPDDNTKISNISSSGVVKLRYNDEESSFGSHTVPFSKLNTSGTTTYKLNSQYFSDETANQVRKDGNINIPSNRPYDYHYLTCDNDCMTKFQNYSSLPSNLKEKNNLHISEYDKLKSLEREINNTGDISRKYYILMMVWFIIAIIIFSVFIITLVSNDSQISRLQYFIVLFFLLYCIYNIYKNIYN